ncbi:hypothetical protein [Bacillus mycoides]|uniref:hypothetical protein n=1 Tax=Bacillus mycoides TaxID=1405 RepID=UPI003555C2A7
MSEVIKMYCSVTLSSPGAMFDVKSPYITDKEFTMAALNDLKYTYLDGYDIYNEVIVEVW